MLQLKKGVENASDLVEELGKVLGTAATASALLHTSTIEIKDLDECATKEEVTAALDALLGVPVSKRDPVKSLRKAYAGTQVAVVALPDDLAATALKLGHVRIGWNEELKTIVTRPQARAALWPGRSPRTADDRILQLNLNHCEAAQDLLCDTISKLRIDVAILCEQYKNHAPPTHGSPMPTAKQLSGCMEEFRCRSAQREYIPTSRGPESAEFSFSASTLHQDSLRGTYPPSLPTSPRRPAAEGPLLLRGTSTHGRRTTTRPSSSRLRTTGLRAGPRRAGATGGTPVLSMWTVSLPSCPAHRSLPGPRRISRRASCPSSPAHVMPRCPRQILAAVVNRCIGGRPRSLISGALACGARRLFQRSRGRHDEETHSANYASARRLLRVAIKTSKRRCWRQLCDE
ncbi:unnamed protein product, partial [Trichogramma brassicae]